MVSIIKECECCGSPFEMKKENIYTVSSYTGLGALFSDNVKYYDAFDCPVCGRQNIVGERLLKCKTGCNEDGKRD